MTSVFRGLVPFSRFRVLELQVPHLIKTRRFLYEGTLLAALMFVFTCKVLPSPNSPGEGGRQGLGVSAGCAGVAEVLCASWGRFESGNKSSEEGGPGRSPAGPVVEIHTPKAGAWGRSLVRELRFHLLHDMAQKKWLFNFFKKSGSVLSRVSHCEVGGLSPAVRGHAPWVSLPAQALVRLFSAAGGVVDPDFLVIFGSFF